MHPTGCAAFVRLDTAAARIGMLAGFQPFATTSTEAGAACPGDPDRPLSEAAGGALGAE